MKYEAPVCEIEKIDGIDIISTSGAESDGTDTPFIDVEVSMGL